MNDEVKERAKRLLFKFSIKILAEKEILEELLLIKDMDEITDNDIMYFNERLNVIEQYLTEKVKNEDMEFLKNLAENLRMQTTRKTDSGYPVLFKIMDFNNQNLFFLTRKKAQEYLEINGGQNMIEILNGDNIELLQLLEVIKRNF